MKSKKYRGKIVAQNLPGPIPFSSEFTLPLSLIFLGCDISRTLAILQLWILCTKKTSSLAAFPHLPPLQSLFLSLLGVSLLWMSGLSVSQSDMIRVPDITPRSREQESREVGGGAGVRMHNHLKTSRGKKKPNLLLWGSWITRQLINHHGPCSFIQLVCFLLLRRSLRCGTLACEIKVSGSSNR